MKHNSIKTIWVAGCLLVAGSPAALGQWQTQSFDLAPGWNAIYTHVDTMHSGIAALANNTPVNEVWMWKPPVSTAQYVTSPDEPSDAKSRWASWKSVLGDNSSVLKRMSGNTAYLVKLGGNVNYTWSVKGKPVPPRYQWTTTGLNFFGVPSVPSNPKSLEDYFADAGYLLQNTQIFAYGGGDHQLQPTRGRCTGCVQTLAKRGQAYWMDAGTQFNRYFGPFSVKLQSVDRRAFRGSTLGVPVAPPQHDGRRPHGDAGGGGLRDGAKRRDGDRRRRAGAGARCAGHGHAGSTPTAVLAGGSADHGRSSRPARSAPRWRWCWDWTGRR